MIDKDKRIYFDWVIKSLRKLLEKDINLIRRKVKEECINHRLATYLEEFSPKEYSHAIVDLEYNKNYDKDKAIEGSDGKIHKIRPDIIIHKREDNYKKHKPLDIDPKKYTFLDHSEE